MSDLIRPQVGARPWRPAEDVVAIETLSYYDGPIAGLIGQSGVRYLYRCISGEIEKLGIWAYAPVDDDEFSQIADAEPHEIDALMDDILRGRPITLALSTEDRGLQLWREWQIDELQEVQEGLARWLAEVSQELDDAADRVHRMAASAG